MYIHIIKNIILIFVYITESTKINSQRKKNDVPKIVEV